MNSIFLTREINETDRDWIKKVMIENWGSEIVVASKTFDTHNLPGFVAEAENKPLGLLIYTIDNFECEIVSLNSFEKGKGVGTALVDKVKEYAKDKMCTKVKLFTTNNNLDALKFYQKRGFKITKTYFNAVEEARKIKPEIPKIGTCGIPIKDFIELECDLS